SPLPCHHVGSYNVRSIIPQQHEIRSKNGITVQPLQSGEIAIHKRLELRVVRMDQCQLVRRSGLRKGRERREAHQRKEKEDSTKGSVATWISQTNRTT